MSRARRSDINLESFPALAPRRFVVILLRSTRRATRITSPASSTRIARVVHEYLRIFSRPVIKSMRTRSRTFGGTVIFSPVRRSRDFKSRAGFCTVSRGHTAENFHFASLACGHPLLPPSPPPPCKYVYYKDGVIFYTVFIYRHIPIIIQHQMYRKHDGP